jgi:hypothetical protein
VSAAPALIRAIDACDYFRRSPWRTGGPRGHKEWMHFCVSGGDLDLLINLSVVDDLRASAAPGSELCRVSVLAHERSWTGAVELYPSEEVKVHGGRVAARFGANHVAFEDGEYSLRVRLRGAPIAADLRLDPVTFPTQVNNVRGLDGRPINWAVLPRSRATGAVRVGDRVYELTGAPTYHDHNWGSFGWGNNFAWEWGYGLPAAPESPWSLVFARLNSRGNTAALMQLFFVWHEERLVRVFRDHDVAVRREGLLRPDRMLKLPPAMGLVAPGLATDIPARLVVRAGSRGDALEAVFTPRDVAQVIIPNDADVGVTIINEVSGTLTVEGSVCGEPVLLENPAVFEFLSA